MKSSTCLGPSLAHAPLLLPAVSPQSPGGSLRVCSHSSAAFFHSPGRGVCAASLSIVCVAFVGLWVSLEYVSVSGRVYVV